MTVSPIPDLIVDVMAAAEPTSQRIATSKLERLSSAVGDFSAAMNEKSGLAGTTPTGKFSARAGVASSTPAGGGGHTPFVKAANSDSTVYRKFEAFVLQMFVESMLPQNASDIFGKGTAGTIWRSMLAEQIGNEMAKGDGIGIAKQLARSRSATDDVPRNES